MADTVLVLDLGSLCTFTCAHVSIVRFLLVRTDDIPAPGGPIKIMRMASAEDLETADPDLSPSSFSKRAVRLATCVLRSSTCLSDMFVVGGKASRTKAVQMCSRLWRRTVVRVVRVEGEAKVRSGQGQQQLQTRNLTLLVLRSQ